MRSILLFLVILFGYPASLSAQSVVNALFLTNRNTGFAVGINGLTLQTTNGGANWIRNSTGFPSALYSVSFINSDTGYAVGASSTVFRTTNGGVTWSNQYTGIVGYFTLRSVMFPNTSVGFIVGEGGNVLKTINGGSYWSKVVVGISQTLTDVYFTSSTNGYLVGYAGTILKTSNGGTSWSTLNSGTSNDLLTLYSVGDTCFAAGSTGTILKTNDGGITWVKLISNTSNNLYKMSFLNSQYGYVVGSGGVILKTTNGGNIWTTKIIGSSIYFRSVQCVDSLVAYAAGYTSGSNGNVAVIYKTSDGGLTWFQQTNIYSADYQLLYLPFNNSVKDESSNKLNVINHGGVLAPDRFGYANNAIRFNGTNQLLSIKDTLAFRPHSFTITGWFCFDTLPTGTAALIDKSIGTGISDVFNLSVTGMNLNAHTGNDSDSDIVTIGSFAPVVNSWFYAAYVFDSVNHSQKLYINDVLVDTATNNKPLKWDDHPILFGSEIKNGNDTSYFSGRMDEIRIYNRILSPFEIGNMVAEKDSAIVIQSGNFEHAITTVRYGGVIDTLLVVDCIPYGCDVHCQVRFPNYDAVKGLKLNITSQYQKDVLNAVISEQEYGFPIFSFNPYTIQILDNNNKLYKGLIYKMELLEGY